MLGSQLTGRTWEAEPPRPATLQDTLTRLIRLGEGNLSQCCRTGALTVGTVTFYLVEPDGRKVGTGTVINYGSGPVEKCYHKSSHKHSRKLCTGFLFTSFKKIINFFLLKKLRM